MSIRGKWDQIDTSDTRNLQRLNWSLTAYGRSIRALHHHDSTNDLAKAVCAAIVQQSVYRLAFIGLAELDERKTIKLVSGDGSALDYLIGLNLSWSEDLPEGRGPAGIAVRSGQPYLMEDAMTAPGFARWRERALRHGIRSSATIPFIVGDRVAGVIGVYAAEPFAFGPEEMAVFSDLANEFAYAMMARAHREKRHALEQQLAQAQKMEAVGQLTGGIAHDFNNLLGVIIGRLEMLQEELAPQPRLREWAQICIRAAQRGASLTRSLLAFSRMQPLNPARVEIDGIIRDMIELLGRVLDQSIVIRLEIEPDLWPCLVDPGQLQNALVNLAVNARDAMPDGGALTVEARNARLDADYVSLHPDATPGEYVLLCVSDTGVGMPPDVLARAFEPFFSTKASGKGSGLGLSMVYGFVKQSGGHVTIYSEVGHGTTVRLYLPRARDDASAASPIAPSPPPRGGNETVLVVEDDDNLRDLTQLQLERLGYRAVVAKDGKEGLDLLQRHPEASLILSDVVLGGGMNGPDFAAKAAQLRPDIGIIFVTGYSGPNALETVANAGPHALLQKPFALDELARSVRAMLDRPRS